MSLSKVLRRNILIIGEYCREDMLYCFDGAIDYFNLYFLYYQFKGELSNKKFEKYGKAIFYYEYTSALHLLKNIAPEKVLFFHLETFNQVALIAACKQLKIKTYHVEHGFTNYELSEFISSHPAPKSMSRPLLLRIKDKIFFKLTAYSSI
ncbi:MAG: hypothetical protein ACYDCN_17355 [Bacteroidia bacterium]